MEKLLRGIITYNTFLVDDLTVNSLTLLKCLFTIFIYALNGELIRLNYIHYLHRELKIIVYFTKA